MAGGSRGGAPPTQTEEEHQVQMPTSTVTTTVTTTTPAGTTTTTTTTTTAAAAAPAATVKDVPSPSAAEGVPPPAKTKRKAYPTSPAEVTAEFLSSLFKEKIATFEVDQSQLEAGVLADAFLVKFTFDDAAGAAAKGLPTRCFFKVTKSIDAVADLSTQVGHVYEKEVYFYRTLRSQVESSVRIPKIYGVFVDESDPRCKEFCLVMECLDTETEWKTFEQFESPMTPEEFKSYLAFIANLHACTWDMPIEPSQYGLGECALDPRPRPAAQR
jgi:hypothetical protein